MSKFQPRVICLGYHPEHACGVVNLTDAEYEYQLMRVDSLWHCPKCKAHAEWDDSCLDGLDEEPANGDYLAVYVEDESRLSDEEIPF